MFIPVGFFWANWSRVSTLPPAAKIRLRAVSVKRKATTVNLGTSNNRAL